MTGFGNTYQVDTPPRRRREWRGVRDTLCDYAWWLVAQKDMLALFLRSPGRAAAALNKLGLTRAFLSLPADVDRRLAGKRGVQLRAGHVLCDALIKHSLRTLAALMAADADLGGDAALAERLVWLDERAEGALMAGFPRLVAVPAALFPLSEAEGNCPVFVKCRLGAAAPTGTDGADEMLECIRAVEAQTGERFDWDAFFLGLDARKRLARFQTELWEINRTRHPQLTAPITRLYALCAARLDCGAGAPVLRAVERARRIMNAGYEKRRPCSRALRRRALICACPGDYPDFPNWLEQCWGIVCLADADAHLASLSVDTASAHSALAGLCRASRRGNGERARLWRLAAAYAADCAVLCTDHDEDADALIAEARERGIEAIVVRCTRPASRDDMRRQVSAYMSALGERPVDPALL